MLILLCAPAYYTYFISVLHASLFLPLKQKVLIRFNIIVPMDLKIEKAFLGGKNYTDTLVTDNEGNTARYFFLPSLLGPEEPVEAWTYKTADSWKTTLW